MIWSVRVGNIKNFIAAYVGQYGPHVYAKLNIISRQIDVLDSRKIKQDVSGDVHNILFSSVFTLNFRPES